MTEISQTSISASVSRGEAGAVPSANQNDLKAAAQQFEAIFIRQMLAAARASDFGGDPLIDGPGLKQFNTMYDDHMAETAAESGAFGFAKVIEAQLASQVQTTAPNSRTSQQGAGASK